MKSLTFSMAFLMISFWAQAQNVGIGTNLPDSKLKVSAVDSSVLQLENSTPMIAGTSTGLFFKTGQYYTAAIRTIGEATSYAGLNFYTYASGNPSSLVKRMTITDGGLVGINNATPAATLDVAGTFRIVNGTQAAGRVLTSDATGLATWQNTAAFTLPYSGTGNNSASLFSIANNGSGVAVSGQSFGTGPGILGYSQSGAGGQFSTTSGTALRANGATELNGTVKIADGTQALGRVLTSDAAGNAAWKTTAYGNTERFQVKVNSPFSTSVFQTFYNQGTAVINYDASTNQISVVFTKAGLYHLDVIGNSTETGQLQPGGSNEAYFSLYIGKDGPAEIAEEFSQFFVLIGLNVSASSAKITMDRYMNANERILIHASVKFYSSLLYRGDMLVSAHLISE